jgi:toxin YoeB
MKDIKFNGKAYEEFIEWAETDKDIYEKIKTLLKDISRDPFKGLGKPEPLKHDLRGYWSRRITKEHRLVYKVEGDMLTILSMFGHYSD